MAPIANVNIASSEFKANPFPFYARLRSEAPVYRTKLPDKRNAWLVTRYQDVVALLKDDRFSKDKVTAQELPWIPSMFKPLMRNMLDLDAPDHTRLRGLVQKAFVPRLIDNLGQRVQGLANELLNRVQPRGRMDLIHDYALQIPTTIIAEMLGVPQKDRLKFHRWSSGAISASASRLGILAAIPHMMAFMRYVRSLVKARRANPEDDLITALVRAEEAGEHLNEDELLAMVVLLLIAGHETTVNLIGNGTLALLENPDCLDASLARLEGQMAIATMLRRTTNLKLAASADGLRWKRGLVLRGLESLPVVFSKQT